MVFLGFWVNYFRWHYGRAFKNLWQIWLNYIWFFYYYFSIPLLFNTFFDPWRRLGEKSANPITQFGQFFGALVVNTLMRIVGIFMRSAALLVGLVVVAFVILSGPILLVSWILAPIFVAVLFISGIILILR